MSGFDQKAESLLTMLREDYQSGATLLALKTLKGLASCIEECEPSNSDLERLLAELRCARPSMVVIGNALAKVASQLAGGQEASAVVRDVISQLENASDTIVRYASEQLPPNAVIMTHSASSLVLRLFRLLAEQHQRFSVICTQSSPGHEGHALARTLNELEVPVTLITDAQMGLFIPRADVVITGCDTWLADGHFVNKSGTRLLALAARERGKPVWVLGDSFRSSDQTSSEVTLEEMPASELGAPEGDWIRPRNIYFETVPEVLVTGRITEQGFFSFPDGLPR